MKPLQTGKLPLDPKAWLAIMSLSLVVNLPGLAVTPMLDTLSTIFPDTTALEKQLLTMLPNLLIIPFVLMSGKLSTTPNKKRLIFMALMIFAGSVVGYMFSRSMLSLIIFSCTLGIGAGMLVPFSTGLLSDTFAGKPLMRQMGLQSAISNLTLVVATFAVGWLGMLNWHMPFLVYGVCLIPLLMLPLLNRVPRSEMDPEEADRTAGIIDAPEGSDARPAGSKPAVAPTPADHDNTMPPVCNAMGIAPGRLASLFLCYFLVTFGIVSISEYLPFLVAARHMEASITGTLTSLFFFLVFLAGFNLTRIVRILKGTTILVAVGCMLLGMCMVTFLPSIWTLGAGIALVGVGYGTMQPLLYDKATYTVCRPSLSTQALAITLSANYGAIVAGPLITEALGDILHRSMASTFPFVVSTVAMVVLVIVAFSSRKTFLGTIPSSYYK